MVIRNTAYLIFLSAYSSLFKVKDCFDCAPFHQPYGIFVHMAYAHTVCTAWYYADHLSIQMERTAGGSNQIKPSSHQGRLQQDHSASHVLPIKQSQTLHGVEPNSWSMYTTETRNSRLLNQLLHRHRNNADSVELCMQLKSQGWDTSDILFEPIWFH